MAVTCVHDFVQGMISNHQELEHAVFRTVRPGCSRSGQFCFEIVNSKLTRYCWENICETS